MKSSKSSSRSNLSVLFGKASSNDSATSDQLSLEATQGTVSYASTASRMALYVTQVSGRLTRILRTSKDAGHTLTMSSDTTSSASHSVVSSKPSRQFDGGRTTISSSSHRTSTESVGASSSLDSKPLRPIDTGHTITSETIAGTSSGNWSQRRWTFSIVDKLSSALRFSRRVTVSANSNCLGPPLEANIDADLLRGCLIKDLLSGYGKAFRNSSGSLEVEASDYYNSRIVSKLDDFISHSWASPRWEKFLALCLVYNVDAVLMSGCVVGLLIMFLQFDSIALLPRSGYQTEHIVRGGIQWIVRRGIWCKPIGLCVSALVFLCWQRLKNAFCLKQKVAFLDRLCVDQVDEERKQAAVLGLGGFLYHSDRLIVCWTPKYFTRLWCVYEVATWLHLGKSPEGVLFVPLHLVQAIALYFFWFVSFLLIKDYVVIESALFVAMFTFVEFVCAWVCIHTARHYVHTLQQLPQQMRRFCLQDVMCHCCSIDHRTPDTGLRIRCDRRLVFRTIAAWFASSVEDREMDESKALAAFEQAVRDGFSEWVLDHVGPTRVPYKWVLACSLMMFLDGCDMLSNAASCPSIEVLIRYILFDVAVPFLVVLPNTFCLALHLAAFFNSVFGFSKHTACNMLASFLILMSMALALVLQIYPGRFFNNWESPIFVIMWNAVCLTLTFALYTRCLRRGRHHSSAQRSRSSLSRSSLSGNLASHMSSDSPAFSADGQVFQPQLSNIDEIPDWLSSATIISGTIMSI